MQRYNNSGHVGELSPSRLQTRLDFIFSKVSFNSFSHLLASDITDLSKFYLKVISLRERGVFLLYP